MSKYTQFLLVILYGFLTMTMLFLVKQLFGIEPHHISDWIVLLVITGWLIICFSAVYWLTDFLLLFMQVRKPILEEEQKLLVAMHTIQRKAGDKKQYRLRVGEGQGLNAYAIGHHTIVVSKNFVALLDHEQLCGLLAHEMGHLRSRDCMATLGFFVADFLPRLVDRIFRQGIKISIIASLLFPIIGIVIVMMIFTQLSVFTIVATTVLFLVSLWILNRVFRFLWLINSRFTEYRQDNFAHQLGFGPALKEVLLLINDSVPTQRVDQYHILTRSTHPILHNRIRRLEKLSGQRR